MEPIFDAREATVARITSSHWLCASTKPAKGTWLRAGTASFKQLDRSLDEASTMLRAGTATTLRRVVLPLLKPALVTALVYSFVRSMTTVSAVIFLVTAENELATSDIIGRGGNGAYGVALAYCTVLIVLMSLATALIQFLVGERRLGRRKPA